MKKSSKIILIVVASIMTVIIIFTSIMGVIFGDKIKAANSIEKLSDGLYYMEYEGDYGFDEFLTQGGAENQDDVASYVTHFLSGGFAKLENGEVAFNFGCSTLTTKKTGSSYVMGRNFDFTGSNPRAMIIHTKPKNGYESYSTTWLDFLGFGEEFVPESVSNKFMSLASVYVPLDGINEKGLCVADLINGDNELTSQSTDKIDVTTTTAIRLLLDKASNVDEAIELLKQYDMHSDIGRSHHLSISDSTGRSVVVEYINNEMIVTDTPVVTNHYLSQGEKFGIGNEESHKRYNELIKKSNNTLSTQDIAKALESVSYQDETQWSIVYDIENLELDFYFQRQFENPFEFSIENK
ncbi:MAG: C45 family peptidase [Acutalibacteraceae bacterium]|nr:C45 family peptidase [Acutalibacteraceae bacterium]